MSKLIICADDFGLTKNVSKSILELSQENKIDATSVMIHNHCISDVKELAKTDVKIGLHFYMTTLPLLSYPTICLQKPLLTYFYIDKAEKEFFKQLNLLEDTIGREVDYIDSHQYLLAFPFIFNNILDSLDSKRLNLKNRVFKLPYLDNPDTFKMIALSHMSKVIMNKHNDITFTNGLYGVSSFKEGIEDIRKNFNFSQSHISKKDGIYHYSTHPCEDPCDIIGVDSLIDFRKKDFQFLKNLSRE